MIVWLVDDDPDMRAIRVEEFSRCLPDADLQLFESLSDAEGCSAKSSPDFVFIDLSAVDHYSILSSDNSAYLGDLRRFVEIYRSAFIVIMCAVVSHSKEDLEDLQALCGDNLLFSIDPCLPEAVSKFCLKYSPPENSDG